MQLHLTNAESIPEDILSIDEVYTMELVLSNKGNGQGKVFLVRKGYNIYAAKIFFREVDFVRENDMLSRIENFGYIVKRQYSNVEARLAQDNGRTLRLPVIVFELMQNGDLQDFVFGSNFYNQTENGGHYRIPIRVCKRLFYGLLKGLQELQRLNIIHRDIKPSNLLFDSNFQLKICDFGYSAINDQNLQGVKVGTEKFYAPEVQASQRAHPKSDNFVMGVILFFAAFYSYPFSTTVPGNKDFNRFDIAQNVQDLKRTWASIEKHCKVQIPLEVKEFFVKIFKRKIEERPSVLQLLESDLFHQMASPEEAKSQLQAQYNRFMPLDPQKWQKVLHIRALINNLRNQQNQ